MLKDDAWRENASKQSKPMLDQNSRLSLTENFVELYDSIEFDEAIPTSTKLPFVLDQDNKTNLFVYVDDRSGKATLLSAAARKRVCARTW